MICQAALNRQKAMEALEASASSSARRRGVWHEARHVAKVGVGWLGWWDGEVSKFQTLVEFLGDY